MKRPKKSEARAEQVESIRRSLVGLRRLFQRRELASLWASAFGQSSELDYFDLRLLDAVRVAGSDGSSGATVGDVSQLLGVDPSRASRQVAVAVRKGLLARVAAQDDARKVLLEITPRGARLQQKGSELTRSRIDLALDGWAAADRELLAELLSRFVVQLTPPASADHGIRKRKSTATSQTPD
jgi:DNA-binding MarR family transcriptional regulator